MSTQNSSSDPCPPKHAKWLNFPLRRLFQQPDKLLRPYVKPGFTAIDIGCGGGYFTAAMANLVGDSGRVIAVDVQPEMLEITRKFVQKKGSLNRVILHQCSAEGLNLSEIKADFVLAFYMVHEVPDHQKFFAQVVRLLKPEGVLLVMEPNFHVSAAHFQRMLNEAQAAKLIPRQPIKRLLSRGMVFTL